MNPLDVNSVYEFVNQNIDQFHLSKLRLLESLDLARLLKDKNPYLFRAKNLLVASDFIESILDAHISSSEEKLFGDFLELLAIFVASQTRNGRKSSATGIDLEFVENNIHFLVSIKSGTNWGNSSQQAKQEENFKTAVKVLKQSNLMLNVQPVLGICYGKTRTGYVRGYLKVVGQNFWYLISGHQRLYLDIIEPLGYRAKEHNDAFLQGKAGVINKFTLRFSEAFCTPDGQIDWEKLVAFNSGNFDLDRMGL